MSVAPSRETFFELQEADEQVAAAEAARTAAEMRVEQGHKALEQLKLNLELQRLTSQAQAAAISNIGEQSQAQTSAVTEPEETVHRCTAYMIATLFQLELRFLCDKAEKQRQELWFLEFCQLEDAHPINCVLLTCISCAGSSAITR
jgi:uncharacterized Rmd1/YagE family protein